MLVTAHREIMALKGCGGDSLGLLILGQRGELLD